MCVLFFINIHNYWVLNTMSYIYFDALRAYCMYYTNKIGQCTIYVYSVINQIVLWYH